MGFGDNGEQFRAGGDRGGLELTHAPRGAQFDAQVGGQQFRLTCPHNLGPDRIVEADIPDAPPQPEYGGAGHHGGGGFNHTHHGPPAGAPPPGLPHTSSQQMMVTVPHGTWPGQMMQVDTPHGRVQVQAPGPPGTQFMIEVPTGGAPPPDPAQAEREMAERFRQEEERRQREIREREAAQQRRMEAQSLERRQREERKRRQEAEARRKREEAEARRRREQEVEARRREQEQARREQQQQQRQQRPLPQVGRTYKVHWKGDPSKWTGQVFSGKIQQLRGNPPNEVLVKWIGKWATYPAEWRPIIEVDVPAGEPAPQSQPARRSRYGAVAEQMAGMGFDLAQANKALEMCDGDVERAVGILTSGVLGSMESTKAPAPEPEPEPEPTRHHHRGHGHHKQKKEGSFAKGDAVEIHNMSRHPTHSHLQGMRGVIRKHAKKEGYWVVELGAEVLSLPAKYIRAAAAAPQPEPEPEPEPKRPEPEPEPESGQAAAAAKIQARYRGASVRRTLSAASLPKQLIGRWTSLPQAQRFLRPTSEWETVKPASLPSGASLPTGYVWRYYPGFRHGISTPKQFVNVLSGKKKFRDCADPPTEPVRGVAARLIVYFESHDTARLLRLKADGKPLKAMRKVQAKHDLTQIEHGIDAAKGDIIVVTKVNPDPTGEAPLPPGWVSGELQDGTKFYYPQDNPDEAQLERPGLSARLEAAGWEVHVASDSGETYYYNTETQKSQWDSPEGDDVGTGYVEVASDDDAVFGSFPWAAVEELPVTHRLAGEVCKYHVDWKGGTRLRHGVVVHSFKLVEAHGHTIEGKLQLSSDALRLLHNDRTLPGYYWTDSGSPPPASAFAGPAGALHLTRKELRLGGGGDWKAYLPAMASFALLAHNDANLWELVGKYLKFKWSVENPIPESEAYERVSKGDLIMGLLNRVAGMDEDGKPLPPSASDIAKAHAGAELLSTVSKADVAAAIKAGGAAADRAQLGGLVTALRGGSDADKAAAIRRQAALLAVGIAAQQAREKRQEETQEKKPEVAKEPGSEQRIAAHKQRFAEDIASLLQTRPSKALFKQEMAKRQLELELRIKAEQ